jgi:pimeloyl-ACP methyl ester carboxylesterase
MGGKTAMSLALQYPTRVSKLIVADIAPKKYDVDAKFSNIITGAFASP